MISIVPKSPGDAVVFSSSLADNTWHQQTDPRSYELWYFDALSDDGTQAITITFLDNFVYSARYNQPETSGSERIPGNTHRFPAVAFSYSRNGSVIYRSGAEFEFEEFESIPGKVGCVIGNSFFTHETAEYGSGFRVVVNGPLAKERLIEAHFEWLSVECDLDPVCVEPDRFHHFCNVVAPRSDVTGRITVCDNNGSVADVIHFRGTGYHHHRMDNRWLADTVADWYWGRAHFTDATAIFCRYRETGDETTTNKLLLVKNGVLSIENAAYKEGSFSRDKFGLRYPNELSFETESGTRLSVRPFQLIFSSFYLLRFVCEMKLTLADEVERTNVGLAEFLVPGVLKNRWVNWLSEV